MKMNTRAGIKKAGAGRRPAGRYELRNGEYRKPIPLSSLKTLIGELLLFGDKQREEFWLLFEVLLLEYVQNIPDKPESTN